MREDPFETFMAAFAKAIAEASPDEIQAALMDRLLAVKDRYDNRTLLRDIVEGAVKTLATEIIAKIVLERAPEIEAQLREKVGAMSIDVRMGDTIAVIPSIKTRDDQ